MKLLARLDAHKMYDPDNREGHVEDICNLCGSRIVDHPGHEYEGIGNGSARWPHRWNAAAELAGQWVGRILARRLR